jgi:magnesium-transporting ATPase (P-type)
VILHYISQDLIEMTYFFPVVVIILNIVVSAITNFFVDLNLKRSCIVINKKEVQKFTLSKNKKKFESKYWESIMPGDIIKIGENQEFPADVLILDVVSNMDHICYVLGSQHEETSLPALKKACEGT